MITLSGYHLQVSWQQEFSEMSWRHLQYFPYTAGHPWSSQVPQPTQEPDYPWSGLITWLLKPTCPFIFQVPTKIRIVRFGSCLEYLMISVICLLC